MEVEVSRAVLRGAPGRAAAARVVAHAIHLATALEAREELDRFFTYDLRLAAAAAEHGVEVAAPR